MSQDSNITATLQLRDEMSKGLQSIQKALSEFDSTWKQAGKTIQSSMASATSQVAKSGQVIVDQMKAIDQQNLKSIAGFTKLTGRLVGMQAGLASLGNIAGESGAEMSKGFRVAQSALNSFSSVVGFLPTPAGVATGAIAALTTALVQLADTAAGRSMLGLIDPDVERRFKAQMERTGKLRIELTALDDALKKLGVSLDLASRDKIDTARAQFAALQQQAVSLKTMLPDLRDELQGFFNAVKNATLKRDRKLTDQMGLALDENDLQQFEMLYYRLRELNEGVGGTDYTRAAIENLGTAFNSFMNVTKRLGATLGDLRNREMSLVNLEVERLSRNLDDISITGAASVKFGLTNPLDAANTEASAARANVEALLSLIQRLKNTQIADPETKKQIEGLAQSLERSTLGTFVSKAKEKEFAALNEKLKEFNVSLGLERGVAEWSRSFKTMKDVALDAFDVIQHSMSDMFMTLMSSSRKWKNGLKDAFRDVANSFKRMLSDMFAQSVMRSGLATLFPASFYGVGAAPGVPGGAVGVGGGGAMQMAGSGVSPLGAAVGLGSMASLVRPAGSGGALSGLFGGSGALGLGAGLSGLLGVGGIAAASQAKEPISGGLLGGAGGALLGASLFTGPLAPLVLGLGGFLFGGLSGSKAKQEEEKQKEQQREAEEEASEALEAQRKRASALLKTHIRSALGGLATPEGAMEVSALLSGDISASELDQFGVDQVLARGSEISGLANANGVVNNVEVGGITVRIDSIASSYDVAQLGADLAYAIRQAGA